ncbi:ABC transporter ATP-binding protein [Granulosicoccus sp.]|nr:ABC transporter ATP-binding protein [Granulosicoccus sp.]
MQQARSNGAIGVELVNSTMRFGQFTALDNVSMKIAPGTFHALLGENGAGKSTLVKCLLGFYAATSGSVLVNDKQVQIDNPKAAQSLGLGMVYQHFTLVPSLTGAENLVISRQDVPARIDWLNENKSLDAFMRQMPFSVPLDQQVQSLSAGEKQKLEIIKQLYLGNRFLVLDEPTSVLTPDEATEILGHVRALTQTGEITVLMITHKFREVTQFANEVTVLRAGKHVGHGKVADLSHADMARMMMGKSVEASSSKRNAMDGQEVLALNDVRAVDKSGLKDIHIEQLSVYAGEIAGIAGISGNGQSELMEILTGQRSLTSGTVRVGGEGYKATRAQARRHKVRYLPEEPLRNACAPTMSVADNLALRIFDKGAPSLWLDRKRIANNAQIMIEAFDIKTRSADEPLRSLSGGNIQRTTLARELSGDVSLLMVANPCFGLDFAAVRAIRDRLLDARNRGVAILLISEDLDELMELSDRILVMSEGRITYQTPIADADTAVIGHHMSGQVH